MKQKSPYQCIQDSKRDDQMDRKYSFEINMKDI